MDVLRERDELWCRAACAALETDEIEELLATFNVLRPDHASPREPAVDDEKDIEACVEALTQCAIDWRQSDQPLAIDGVLRQYWPARLRAAPERRSVVLPDVEALARVIYGRSWDEIGPLTQQLLKPIEATLAEVRRLNAAGAAPEPSRPAPLHAMLRPLDAAAAQQERLSSESIKAALDEGARAASARPHGSTHPGHYASAPPPVAAHEKAP